MTNKTNQKHWDIFCVVVDNYGDIGVTWRLAKQLVAEYQIPVNLWVDDLRSFSHILPDLDSQQDKQTFNDVNIIRWSTPLSIKYQPGAVIIEAFACELPDSVLKDLECLHLCKNEQPPVWLNLEYLSAETWVDGCHGLPSLQTNGLKKHFYFPGFTDKTGGLICEQNLHHERQIWQNDNRHKQILFAKLGLTDIGEFDKVISVFSYETTALKALCTYWAQGNERIHALIPKGRSLNSLSSFLSAAPKELLPGQQFSHGNLTIHILPMTNQQGYDQLLWSCDYNIVRGEDSFLRAQWAARPFVWHIYPQEEDYHLEKLQAFMALYCNTLAPEIASTWSALNLAFNQEQSLDVTNAWQELTNINQALLQHAQKWPIDAINGADLATRLVQFVKNS